MLLFRSLEVTGIAGNSVSVESLIGKMGLVFETYFFGVLNFLLRHRFTVMATGLKAGAIFDYWAYG